MVMDIKQTRSEVPAVEAAIKILEYLSRFKHRTSSLSDIARNLSINKSTCHRILKVLENHHFVFYQEATKQYSLGSHLVILGARASEFIDYLELSKPYLKWLCQETKQTCVLLEPISNNRLVYVAKEEANLPVKVTVTIGQQFPLTSASFGKCFLAFMDETKAEEIIKASGFRQFTSKTITNLEQFKKELESVRLKGYAESYEEHTPGVCGVAAPIFDLHGNVKQVISCVFLAQELNTEGISVFGRKVLEASRKLTVVFNGRTPF